MNRLAQFFRLIHINFVLAKYGLDKIVFSLHLFSPLQFLVYFNPWNWHRPKDYSRGKAIRLALEELGPIFVKLGQALSTRRDLLPDDIAAELALLQDKVPPFSTEQSRKVVAQQYGCAVEEVFLEFADKPLASASIAQVHVAKLRNGQEVVVKVLRPGIRKVIRRDVSLMYTLARLAERFWHDTKRLRPQEVIAEFEKTLLDELDLMREAASASQLRRNFLDSHLLYVPEIYWEYARERVMVMERISGIPITDIEQLKRYNIDIKKLAERGVEIFFTQVFRDCFFHADMHPGNLFVSYDNPKDPQYVAVDFGIMGSLSKEDQRYLADNFLAFFHRDYRRVAELHVESGWVPPGTPVNEFEAAIRTVCEPIFERPLKDISCGQMLMRLFQTGRRFNMEVQPQLVLLQKTLLAIEGLGRQLYPELDLWSTAKPYLEGWLKDQVSLKAFTKKIQDNLPFWSEKLPELPTLMYETLHALKEKNLQQQTVHMLLSEQQQPKQAARWQFILGALLGAAISAAIIVPLM